MASGHTLRWQRGRTARTSPFRRRASAVAEEFVCTDARDCVPTTVGSPMAADADSSEIARISLVRVALCAMGDCGRDGAATHVS